MPAKTLKFIKEEVIGTENTFYASMVLLAVIGIIAMGFVMRSPSISFHGIAGSRDLNVNYDYPVSIKRVHVNAGQHVHKGELLLEVEGGAKGKQYIFAESDGVVGSVNFGKGENAPAFSPLVTVSSESPTFVQGYVHEALNSDLRVGMPVSVSSMGTKGTRVAGRVAGLGARFVQIPERLNSFGRIAWGREVQVEILPDNKLLLGEKVVISPSFAWLQSFTATASEDDAKFRRTVSAVTVAPRQLKISPALNKIAHVELSGAVYLSDLKKYLIASDDPGKHNPPYLFLLSDDGEVEEAPVVITGIKKLKDVESVSSDAGYDYALTSLWAKGKERVKFGNEFLRFRRDGLKTTDTQVLEFGGILRTLMNQSRDPVIQELMRHEARPIEVEAHAVLNGDLYIGLKAPLLDNDDSVILRIPDVNRLFEKRGKQSTVQVWKKIRFPEERHRLSDITFVNGTLYVTTTRKKVPGGAFWSVGQADGVPRLLRAFPELRPEALAYNPTQNLFLLGFDGGKEEPSNYLFVAGPRAAEE